MSEPTPYDRDSSALAFALTRIKLSLPYSVEVACDLEQFMQSSMEVTWSTAITGFATFLWSHAGSVAAVDRLEEVTDGQLTGIDLWWSRGHG